jgi:hypothetical protein
MDPCTNYIGDNLYRGHAKENNKVKKITSKMGHSPVATRIAKQGPVQLPRHWYPSVPAYQEPYRC